VNKQRFLSGLVIGLFIAGSAAIGASMVDHGLFGDLYVNRSVWIGKKDSSSGRAAGDLTVGNDLFIGSTPRKAIGSDNQVFGAVPATQTIAAGNTVTADACGGVKNVTAAGAVTTDTTNTFTAPAAANKGCVMQVCNVGSNAITLDDNALFAGSGIAGATPGDTVLGADDCVAVGSSGSIWRQLAPGSQN